MNANWLAELAPDAAPAPPSWWPPAPGWWVFALTCVVLLAGLAVWLRGSGPARRARRAALAELRRIRSSNDPVNVAQPLQRLLRRYALTVFGREQVAQLSGDSWLEFIVSRGGDGFAGEHGRAWLRAAFGSPAAPLANDSWLAAAERFIRRASRNKKRRT